MFVIVIYLASEVIVETAIEFKSGADRPVGRRACARARTRLTVDRCNCNNSAQWSSPGQKVVLFDVLQKCCPERRTSGIAAYSKLPTMTEGFEE